MRDAADYYARSPHYRGERLMRFDDFAAEPQMRGEVVILGRNGHYHHYDLDHIRLLREKGKLPAGADTTLVLYDWHEDLDHDPNGTELGNGTWGYVGLTGGSYANMYVLGVNPRGYSELNPSVFEDDEIRAPTEETMKLLDRVYLYPLAPSYYCLKFFPECESYLAANESVDRYFPVPEGGFVQVRFRAMNEATYQQRKGSVIVSIDLDVLRVSEMKADCPQGAASVDHLLGALDALSETGRVGACLICGLTESPDLHTEQSFESLARILARCSQMLER